MFDTPIAIVPSQTTPAIYEVFKFVAIIVAGAFGGFCYAVSSLLDEGKTKLEGNSVWEACRGASVQAYIVGQAAIGTGGAFAGLFGMLTVGNAVRAGSTDTLTDNPIYLVALSVVGGFVGNQILRGVGEKFAKQMTDVKQSVSKVGENAKDALSRAEKAETRAERAETLVREAREMIPDTFIARELVDQLEACRTGGQSVTEGLKAKAADVLQRLDRYQASFPTERVLNIVLANLKFELGLTDEAFAQLQSFLSERSNAGLTEGVDDSAAWFNIACYNIVLSQNSPSGAAAEARLLKAQEALTQSLKIAKTCGPEELKKRLSRAREDSDLKSVIGLPAFQELLKAFVDE